MSSHCGNEYIGVLKDACSHKLLRASNSMREPAVNGSDHSNCGTFKVPQPVSPLEWGGGRSSAKDHGTTNQVVIFDREHQIENLSNIHECHFAALVSKEAKLT